MKKIIPVLLGLSFCSCTNKETEKIIIRSPEVKRIESINIVRQKRNDSIAILNKQPRFQDLGGTHQLKYTSDGIPSFTGTIYFENKGRDLYDVSGKATAGKNSLKITGTVTRVSEQHLNFEGEIIQKINGQNFTRTNKSTFFDEGKGNYWRLQNKVNGSGFVDHIDIYF